MKANDVYQEKLKKGKKSDKAMFELSWKVEELSRLCEESRAVRIELDVILDRFMAPESISPEVNVAGQVSATKKD